MHNLEVEQPKGWEKCILGDVVKDIVGGGTPSKSVPEYFEGDIPLMTVKDMKVRRPTATGFNITAEALANSSARMIPVDTVIIATRMGLGKVVRAKFPTAINQDLKALFAPPELEKSFLEFWLLSIASKLESMGTGTTVKGLRLEKIRALDFFLPPLNEQQRIVEKVEALFARLDKGEEAVREVQKLLTRYRQSVLKSAVTGQLTKSNKSGWETGELGSLLKDLRYGTAKKCGYEIANTAVLRIPNVVGGKISLDNMKYTNLTKSESEKLALELGDILIVRSNGSVNLVARGAVVGEEAVGMSYAGYLIRLRVDQDRILPEYLQMSMSSPQTRSLIERQARSTSGVHNINSGEVKAVIIELPPVSEQIKIMTAVDDAFQKIAGLERWCETELKRSTSLRQSILKNAFSGQLVPQDPNDEPASKLLARIAAEKPVTKKARRKKAV